MEPAPNVAGSSSESFLLSSNLSSPFDLLPAEVAIAIFAKIPLFDLLNTIQLVSRKWQLLSQDPHLWQLRQKGASFFLSLGPAFKEIEAPISSSPPAPFLDEKKTGIWKVCLHDAQVAPFNGRHVVTYSSKYAYLRKLQKDPLEEPALKTPVHYGNSIDQLITLGSRLITVHRNKLLLLHDLDPLAKTHSLGYLFKNRIWHLAPLPPNRLLSAGNSPIVTIWSAAQNILKPVKELRQSSTTPCSAVIALKDRGACAYADSLVIWDLEKGQPLWTYDGHQQKICQLIAESSSLASYSSKEAQLNFWDLRSPRPIALFSLPQTQHRRLLALSDGKLFSADGRMLSVWDMRQSKLLHTREHSSHASFVSLVVTKNYLSLGTSDGYLITHPLSSDEIPDRSGHEKGAL
ncbi:MAG: hypothetical protein K0S07_829 [Chlamydiales bacterium]|jgi:hypothetical protein|nr:hypothetical protein [Chlamydiales bacterium]